MTNHQRSARDIQAAPPVSEPTAQHGSAYAKVIITFLSVLVLAFSAMGYFTIGRLGNDVASAANLGLGGDDDQREKAADGAVDILLVGTDSRTDAQGEPLPEEELARMNAGIDDGEENTDTMMLIRVPNDGSRATAVSIPRDTYISDGEFGNMKINGVYAAHKQAAADDGKSGTSLVEAGRSGLIDAVGDLTGVDIDHYAEIGLHGFVSLTNAVGGVDVCLTEPVNDEFSGAVFPDGEQTLDGYQALAFVRQRHGLPRGDLDRIVRQQAFMASLVNKILSAGTLANPSKLSDLSKAVEKSVIIDEGWNIVSFGSQLADLAGGNVTFTTIPVTSVDGVGDYGESIVTVDSAEVHEFFDDMTTPETATATTSAAPGAPTVDPALADMEVHVLNAGTLSGQADGVGGWLGERGVNVTETANALEGVYSMSQVVAADPTSEAAIAMSELLGGLPITTNDGLDDSTIIVVTADDYAGPAGEPGDTSPSAAASSAESEPVGTPGADFGNAEVAPEITAGGSGPRCIN